MLVNPAKAGIQFLFLIVMTKRLDSSFRWNDG